MIASDYPITLLTASFLAMLYLLLCANVVRHRIKSVKNKAYDIAVLERIIRVQVNFAEYVPVALILLFLLENSDVKRLVLVTLSSILIAGRLFHAWGLTRKAGRSFGRTYGTFLTWLAVLVMVVNGFKILFNL